MLEPLTISTLVWLAQVGSGLEVLVALAGIGAVVVTVFYGVSVAIDEAKPHVLDRLKKMTRTAWLVFFCAGAPHVAIPNMETIMYSAMIQYGPEYVERVMQMIEKGVDTMERAR